jgi:tetratricopeptide (TPR) repeat protein
MAQKRLIKNNITAKSDAATSPQSSAKQKISLFPRIYRFITESWKLLVSSFVSCLIIIAIADQGFSLYQSLQTEKKLREERGQVEKEIVFWKNSLRQYPNHRDIYFRLATLEYRLGNTDAAAENLQKTLKIDPNFEKGREMEKLIKQ